MRHWIASMVLELLELPKHAFQLKASLKESDETLDCNPQTVKKQIKIQHQRIQEKRKRMKADSLKRQNSTSSQSKTTGTSSTAPAPPKKVVLTKMVTVPQPVLGKQNGNKSNSANVAMNGIKRINLKSIGKLTPPSAVDAETDSNQSNAKGTADRGDKGSAKEETENTENEGSATTVDAGNEGKQDTDVQGTGDEEGLLSSDQRDGKSMHSVNSKKRDKKRDRSRRRHKSRDRDDKRERRRERKRDKKRDRSRRRHKSRDRRSGDWSSSDSDYYRSRHRDSSRRS